MERPVKKTKIKIELPEEAIAILNGIASEWRTERRNLKIGVATVAAEFVMERLRRAPQWKKQPTKKGKPARK